MELMVTLLLLSTLALVLSQRMRDGVAALAVQGVALAGIALAAGLADGTPHLFGTALVALAVKGVAIPLVLLRVLQALRVQAEVERILTTKAGLLISLGLTMLAYSITGGLDLPAGSLPRLGLPVALTLVLVGAFLMITRQKALSQVMGLIVVENGLSLAALVLVAEMSLMVDLALSFDALVGVMIMGIFVQRIQAAFHSANTKPLRKLRG